MGCAAGNFRKGRSGSEPQAIVIHVIVGSLASAGITFGDARSSVSAHYGVGKDGTVHQFVEETDTAFHAGIVVRPTWANLRSGVNPNLYTIGIEHEGLATDLWTDDQYGSSGALIHEIGRRWRIPLDRGHVVMHREIRASKTCPGMADMNRLIAGAGLMADAVTAPPLKVVTEVHANLRQGAPSTRAPVTRTLPAGAAVECAGFTEGEAVDGNTWWYVTASREYLWAGATGKPAPGLTA